MTSPSAPPGPAERWDPAGSEEAATTEVLEEAAAAPAGPRCREISLDAAEPLAASAPVAQAWLVVEQSGPWGRKALLDSRLPEGVGPALAQASEGTGTTVLLARRPGRSAGAPERGPARRFWLAHTAPGGVRMRSGVLDDVRALLDVDLRAAARGELPPLGTKTTEPLLLVCANAKRDACCALLGRPLAAELAADPAVAETVWESSHLGGHRFAPTALLLPWGTSYGRVDQASLGAALAAARAGQVSIEGYRGRTALRRWLQAAEIAVRRAHASAGIDDLDVLRVTPSGMVVPAPVGTPAAPTPETAEAEVRHADGRAWRVLVTRTETPARPESCGGDPVVGEAYTASVPVALPPWRSP